MTKQKTSTITREAKIHKIEIKNKNAEQENIYIPGIIFLKIMTNT